MQPNCRAVSCTCEVLRLPVRLPYRKTHGRAQNFDEILVLTKVGVTLADE